MRLNFKTNMNNIECGQILLSLENSSCRGKIMLNCLLCNERFHGFQDYVNHLLFEHYPQIELEDRNYRSVKKEINFESTEEYVNASANAFLKFLEMDINNDSKALADFDKIMVAPKCPEIQSENGDLLPDAQTNINITKNKKCTQCHRTFFLASTLKHHLNEHRGANGSKGAQYKCHICKTKFHLKFSLKQHLREHKMNNSQTFSDGKRIIPAVSKRKQSIKHNNVSNFKNITLKTTESDEFQNMNVDNTCSSSSLLEKGNTPTFQVGKNPALEFEEFQCEICNKKFQGLSRYNSHMQRHKPCEFKCGTCLKEFKTAGELQTHTRFHTGERPYLCSSCGEKFATGSKLTNHTRRHHTFERPKQCPICKKKFFGSGELKVHLQATHSNERNYKCTLCPSTFNRPFSLRTHMKSHENKREFKCDFCSASFNQKCNLTAHKKKTHCLLIDDDNTT